MGLWSDVNGLHNVSAEKLSAWRIVEDQSKSTTRKFVDTSQEHDLLEALIEQSKPTIKYYGDEKYFKNLHYLLATPFRYPPLKWGSRFGTKFERSLLYCSIALDTAMSEIAFYRLAFLHASEGKLGGKVISYTAFKINVAGDRYINLCEKPFDIFEEQISSKLSYQFAQDLGKEMRADHITCFKYKSARCKKAGLNIGIFSPIALLKNNQLDKTFEHLNCYSTKDVVEFSFKHKNEIFKHIFPISHFLINGNIPLPPD